MDLADIERQAIGLAESGTATDADFRALAYLVAKLAEQINKPATPEKTL